MYINLYFPFEGILMANSVQQNNARKISYKDKNSWAQVQNCLKMISSFKNLHLKYKILDKFIWILKVW
jgi:hypothetical protein